MILRHLLSSFFLYLICFQIGAAEPSAYVDMKSYPSSFINGTVNVITGVYSEGVVETLVPGPTPLKVARYYSSHPRRGWIHGDFDTVDSFPKNRIYAHDPSGALTVYSDSSPTAWKYCRVRKFQIDLQKHKTLLTNCARGEISAKTNLKNTYVEAENGILRLFFPDASVKVYGKAPCIKNLPPKNNFQRLKHHFPTNNRIEYEYNNMMDLIKVLAKRESDDGLQTFLTHLDGNYRHLHSIKGSNHRWIQYDLPDVCGVKTLTHVSSSEGPDVSYFYDNCPSKRVVHPIIWH